MAHPPMRTLALTIVAFNVTYGAAWAVLVLYASERLGMDAVGFGLLTTAIAIGGIVGTASYGRLERRFALADIMRVGLLIETFTHLVLALTTSPVVALVTMVVFGAHAFVWGTTSTVVRQRAVPDELLGRVTGIYIVGVVGGIVDRHADRRPARSRVRHHGAVLVRLLRVGATRGAPVAPVRPHRPRQRGVRRVSVSRRRSRRTGRGNRPMACRS